MAVRGQTSVRGQIPIPIGDFGIASSAARPLGCTKAQHNPNRALKFAPSVEHFRGEPFRPAPFGPTPQPPPPQSSWGAKVACLGHKRVTGGQLPSGRTTGKEGLGISSLIPPLPLGGRREGVTEIVAVSNASHTSAVICVTATTQSSGSNSLP